MKLNFSIITKILPVAFIGALAMGCEADYSTLEDMAYITQTKTQTNVSKTVEIAENPVYVDLSARISNPGDGNKDFTFSVSQSALDKYNEANKADYTLLPEDAYVLENPKTTITEGNVFSEVVKVKINPFSEELMDSGKKYAIAFNMASDDANIMSGANEIVYLLRPTIITSVPVLGTCRYDGFNYYASGKAVASKEVALDAWTVEMRVNMDGYSINNQALFGNWGTKSEIYMRFGDAPIPYNTLQVKFGEAGQFDRSNAEFVPNKWYHIAVVYDGSKCTLYIDGNKDLDTDKPAGRVFNLSPEMHFASSGSRWFQNACMMSEVRIWSIARTQSQIQDNMYSVSTSSEGLLHYWKMNEGQGTEFKDYASVDPAPIKVSSANSILWLDNVRSDGKGRTDFN